VHAPHRLGVEADRVREAFLARDRERAARLVTDEIVDAMTILGTPAQCRAQMQRFFDAGVQEIRLVFNEPDEDAYLRALPAVASGAGATGTGASRSEGARRGPR
jgi:alkanesulfonate monooxygenase SsuD/methylene tetrahydromethanopterin reductase-like flavin-dependent oxidoreductase (luciferase family)